MRDNSYMVVLKDRRFPLLAVGQELCAQGQLNYSLIKLIGDDHSFMVGGRATALCGK